MKEKISGKRVGYDDTISGVIDVDPDYNMILMETYVTLDRSGNERK